MRTTDSLPPAPPPRRPSRGRAIAAAVLLGVAALGSASAACVVTEIECDAVVRRCRTRCDYWCDGWGCWPSCWDQCWDECVDVVEPEPVQPPASGSDDAGASPDPAAPGSPAVLCRPCSSNDDCSGGGLCIVRGGEGAADAGTAGVCGVPCAGAAECPVGFRCEALGNARQCVPEANACQ